MKKNVIFDRNSQGPPIKDQVVEPSNLSLDLCDIDDVRVHGGQEEDVLMQSKVKLCFRCCK